MSQHHRTRCIARRSKIGRAYRKHHSAPLGESLRGHGQRMSPSSRHWRPAWYPAQVVHSSLTSLCVPADPDVGTACRAFPKTSLAQLRLPPLRWRVEHADEDPKADSGETPRANGPVRFPAYGGWPETIGHMQGTHNRRIRLT